MLMEGFYRELLMDAGLEPAVVEKSRNVSYILNPGLCITYCNPQWTRFALENGGIGLSPNSVLGTCVLDAAPKVLRPFYTELFHQGKEQGIGWEHEYECSSPSVYRRFLMRATPLGHAYTLVENLARGEYPHQREEHAPIAGGGFEEGEERIVTMCSHCRRTKRSRSSRGESWEWVPRHLENQPRLVSHGLCEDCLPLYFGEVTRA